VWENQALVEEPFNALGETTLNYAGDGRVKLW
jgi:hypothetical protein